MKKRLKYIAFILLGALVVGEIVLRFFGFGNPPLYVASDKYEYIYAPNQNLKRIGNRILTNEHSIRSAPMREKDKVKVLFFGDSIIHGGARTDHDSLAVTRLEKAYQQEFGASTRVLNASCGSWGPDNAFAYLQEKGDFEAERFVMVFSSHDYTDFMNFKPIVGNLLSYPEKKPLLATGEVLNRFVIPRITGRWMKDPDARPKVPASERQGMNPGWESFRKYCEVNQIPLLVVLHPEKKEVEAGAYNEKGQKLIEWLERNEIDWISELEEGTQPGYFRDYIHYNDEGQRYLFRLLSEKLPSHGIHPPIRIQSVPEIEEKGSL